MTAAREYWLRINDPGAPGRAASFTNAAGRYLWRPSATPLQAGTSFTLALWVRYTAPLGTTYQCVASKYGVLAADHEYGLYRYAGTTLWFVGGRLVQVPTPDVGVWHLLTAWHDAAAGVAGLRLDTGTPVTLAGVPTPAPGQEPFRLGVDTAPSHTLDGDLDSVGFWRGRVLTSADVAVLYNGGRGLVHGTLPPGMATNLSAWWDLDETSGTRCDPAGGMHLGPGHWYAGNVGEVLSVPGVACGPPLSLLGLVLDGDPGGVLARLRACFTAPGGCLPCDGSGAPLATEDGHPIYLGG